MICTTNTLCEGLVIMQKALHAIDECIKKYNGTLKVIEAPKTMTQSDEKGTFAQLHESNVKDEESDEDSGSDEILDVIDD